MLRVANDILCFILELCMLASFGIFGTTREWPLLPRILFTIILLAVAILLWAAFAAPASQHRFRMPYLAFFRAGIFIIAFTALYFAGYRTLAGIFILLSICNQALSLLFENKDTSRH